MKTKYVVIFLILILLIGCNTDQTIEKQEEKSATKEIPIIHQIILENNKVSSTDIIINKGDVVEWVNKDQMEHTITYGKTNFHLPPGGTEVKEFQESGQFHYYSQSGVQGSIIVR